MLFLQYLVYGQNHSFKPHHEGEHQITHIMQTCLCNEHPLTPHLYIVKVGFTGEYIFLAHLSRRLIGELIVYDGIRRPSVVPLSTFSNDISSEAARPILFIFHI